MNFEPDIKIIRGELPEAHQKEYEEWQAYESGHADEKAAKERGPYDEPWLNVIHSHEPASMPALDRILIHPELRRRLRGKILDVGAGTCWVTAKMTLLPEVTDVFALDLSERFMKDVGVRIMNHFEAKKSKVTFVISDFNKIPLNSESLDCAVLFASLHHSLCPIKTLQEAARCVRPGGCLMILENPHATVKIRQARKLSLALSNGVTEIAYTKDELEYLFETVNVGPVRCYTLDVLSRPGPRRWARKIFRALKLEAYLLNPPTYLFLIERK